MRKYLRPVLLVFTAVAAVLATSFAPPAPARAATTPKYDHIYLVVMENHSYSQIVGSSSAPYINKTLIANNAVATNYSNARDLSVYNYMALTAGQTFYGTGANTVYDGCTPGGPVSNSRSCNINGPKNIVTEIGQSGRTWRAYEETMPAPCSNGASYGSTSTGGRYAAKHDPFPYFQDIRTNPTLCKNYEPYTRLATDLSNNTVPNFAFVTPNLCSDGHDTCGGSAVGHSDQFLSKSLPAIFNSSSWKTSNSLLILTWDEGSGTSSKHVLWVGIRSQNSRGHVSSATAWNHYSTLRTIEDSWSLAPLTSNDASATNMSALLGS
jgi:acid phosphatase